MANIAPSPWASVANYQPGPAPPGELDPVNLGTSAPKVFAPVPPSPQDQVIQQDQARLEKIRWQQQNPWGTPENHPGKLGKIAHVFSTLGNIAGDIFAPGVMERIPGTEANMQQQENGLTHRLNTEVGDQSLNQYRGAETGKTEEETKEAPAKAASEEALQTAQGGEAGARTKTLENPPEEWKAIPTIQGPNGEPVEIESKSGNIRFGGVQGAQPAKQPKPDSPEQQYIDEYQRLHKGSTIADAERAYAADTQKPERAPITNILIPNGKGGYTVQGATAGSTVAPGAVTPSGMNTMNTPTAQSRNMAEMAATVLPQAASVKNEVEQLAQSVGPAIGRWNQLMINKGGADFPEFAGLDQDLDLLSSAIVRTHFGARGGQQYREELRKMLGEAQSPADLIARIDHADGWLEGYAHMADRGNGGNRPQVQEPPRPANVPDGYKFNANGLKGAGWYAPTAK